MENIAIIPARGGSKRIPRKNIIEFKGKPMKVVVSSIDGHTYGERPFSIPKIASYSGLLSAIAIIIGLAWCAGGLL